MKEIKLFKSPIALILLVLSLISCTLASLKGNNVMIYSGIVGALTLYTKRNLDKKSLSVITKIYVAAGIFFTLAGVIVAVIKARSYMWMSISENFLGGVLFIAMVIFAQTKFTDFICECSKVIFWVIFGLVIVVVPVVIASLALMLGFVFKLIIAIALLVLALFAGSMTFSLESDRALSNKGYKDRRGMQHNSFDSMQVANKRIYDEEYKDK